MTKVASILHRVLFSTVIGLAYVFSVVPGLSSLGEGMISSRHLGIASRAEQAGEYEAAARHFQKVIDISPTESTKDIAREALGALYERGLGVSLDLVKLLSFSLKQGQIVIPGHWALRHYAQSMIGTIKMLNNHRQSDKLVVFTRINVERFSR